MLLCVCVRAHLCVRACVRTCANLHVGMIFNFSIVFPSFLLFFSFYCKIVLSENDGNIQTFVEEKCECITLVSSVHLLHGGKMFVENKAVCITVVGLPVIGWRCCVFRGSCVKKYLPNDQYCQIKVKRQGLQTVLLLIIYTIKAMFSMHVSNHTLYRWREI